MLLLLTINDKGTGYYLVRRWLFASLENAHLALPLGMPRTFGQSPLWLLASGFCVSHACKGNLVKIHLSIYLSMFGYDMDYGLYLVATPLVLF